MHIAVICCFFLPFFYTGCERAKDLENSSAYEQSDTTAQVVLPTDTIPDNEKIDSTASNQIVDSVINTNDSDPDQTDTLNNPLDIDESDGSWSNIIVAKYTFLKPLLIPEKYTYSGMAIVIDSIPYVPFISSLFSLLFLILSLSVKYIERTAIKSILLVESLALVFLLISMPHSWNVERLWGYWIAFSLTGILVLFDFFNRVSLSDRENG